jgi:hypothetical protein
MKTTNSHGLLGFLTRSTTLFGTALLAACASPTGQTSSGTDPAADPAAANSADDGLASAATPQGAPPALIAELPAMPEDEGCYSYTASRWEVVPCATDDYVEAHYPHPELQFSLLSVPKTGKTHHTVPLVYGVVLLTFEEVGTEKDSAAGAEAWSIQNNTNLFTGTNGHLDGVQFADQSDPNGPDGVCVWNVDVTTQDYSARKCVSVPRVRPGGFVKNDQAQVTGKVVSGDRLSVQAFLPWSGSIASWGVVTKDKFGLAGHWTEVSGSVLGEGGSSKATFSSARVWTRLLAASCKNDNEIGTWGDLDCPSDAVLEPSAIASNAGNTGESNNLVPVIGKAPANEPTISWANKWAVYTDYVSTTTGDCPKDTSLPYCDPQ